MLLTLAQGAPRRCYAQQQGLLNFGQCFACHTGNMTDHHVQILAEREKLPLLETSALQNANVEEAFQLVLTEIYQNATRDIFAADEGEQQDLSGKKVELHNDEPGSRIGLWSSSCCGAVTRLMGLPTKSKQV